jgi:lipopolysaccharide/colanic/teichoic acid biosynthesis glycosyltransferase
MIGQNSTADWLQFRIPIESGSGWYYFSVARRTITLAHDQLQMAKNFYGRYGKRWLDAAASAAGLVVLSPLLLGVAIAVRLSSPGPVLFRQVRTGRFGRPFRIFKFRTMIEDAVCPGNLVTAGDDLRITRLGRWLRKTKIDELPQLINVLLGEMSVVGPRPEISEYTENYSEKYRRLLLARPGITGPAATAYVREEEILAGQADRENFYAAEILPRKLELDLIYCEDIRFFDDIKLIFRTFWKIFETFRPAGRDVEGGEPVGQFYDCGDRENAHCGAPQ